MTFRVCLAEEVTHRQAAKPTPTGLSRLRARFARLPQRTDSPPQRRFPHASPPRQRLASPEWPSAARLLRSGQSANLTSIQRLSRPVCSRCPAPGCADGEDAAGSPDRRRWGPSAVYLGPTAILAGFGRRTSRGAGHRQSSGRTASAAFTVEEPPRRFDRRAPQRGRLIARR